LAERDGNVGDGIGGWAEARTYRFDPSGPGTPSLFHGGTSHSSQLESWLGGGVAHPTDKRVLQQ